MNSELGFVYHGSPREFDGDQAVPKRNIRSKWNKETQQYDTIFDQESFHATPHKWIALAYTYKSVPLNINGKKTHYNMGVSLYEDTHEVAIYGTGSLEESLKVLYGEGGWLYHFDGDTFVYTEGLGNLEVITETPTSPIKVERIDDPVSEMRALGVNFVFKDISIPENARDLGLL